eukprot:3357533-Prymnesium_polylepis.1
MESMVPSPGAEACMHDWHQQANLRCRTTPLRTPVKRNVFFMPGILSYSWSGFGRIISLVGV